jgi:hypothetical protein
VGADLPAVASACQVIDVCAVAQPGVACHAKQVFGRPRGLPPARTLKCEEWLPA